jgi:flavin reductase (DIM6/NTAB) family NADH-FMN oxidoreductase RutF
MTTEIKSIDPKSFWRALGERITGITIVTARGKDGPAGFLGLSASHVCADPPTMLVSIDDNTAALSAVLESKHFAISFLPANAKDVADIFFGKTALKGADRFEAGRWSTLTTGAPVLNDALGAFDCALIDTHRVGTTTICIGRVLDLVSKGEGTPLVFFRGQLRDG